MRHAPESPSALSVEASSEQRATSARCSLAGLVLRLVLTNHWYDETAAGRKRVEYRTMTEEDGKPSRWYGQIWLKRHEIKRVRFSRGYTPTTLTFSVVKIDIGPCNIPGWNGEYYRIHFTEPNNLVSNIGALPDARKTET